MSESDTVRARRLEIAAQDALEQKLGPTHLIGVVESPEVEEPERIVVENPIEGSCYDALVYLREGMTRKEVIDAILLRNKISKEDAEKIVDQVSKQTRKEQNGRASAD
jgi:hypothetical protein